MSELVMAMRKTYLAGVLILLVALFSTVGSMHALAQRGNDLVALKSQLSRLYERQVRRCNSASRAIRRRGYGEHNGEYAIAISSLANVYNEQGRYAEAEPLHK